MVNLFMLKINYILKLDYYLPPKKHIEFMFIKGFLNQTKKVKFNYLIILNLFIFIVIQEEGYQVCQSAQIR